MSSNNHHTPDPSAPDSPAKQALLHRYWELQEESQAEILDTLAVAEQSQVGFKRYVDGLKEENLDDLNRLAGLWDLIDEEHPEGFGPLPNPFRDTP
jgi:hypothetical protein